MFAATGEKRAPPVLIPPPPPPGVPLVFYAFLSFGVALGGFALAYRLTRPQEPAPEFKPYETLKRLEREVIGPMEKPVEKPLAGPTIALPDLEAELRRLKQIIREKEKPTIAPSGMDAELGRLRRVISKRKKESER